MHNLSRRQFIKTTSGMLVLSALPWNASSTFATLANDLQPPIQVLSTLDEVCKFVGENSLMVREGTTTVPYAQLAAVATEEARNARTITDAYPAIRTLLKGLGDKHSFLLKREDSEARKAGKRRSLGFSIKYREGMWVIASVFPDSPAAMVPIIVQGKEIRRNGIPVGARVLKVGEEGGPLLSLEGVPANKYPSFEHQDSRVLVLQLPDPDGRVTDPIRIRRGQMYGKLNTPPRGIRLIHKGRAFGYIQLFSFNGTGEIASAYVSTVQGLIQKIDEGGPVCGYIVDNSENGGGYLEYMVAGVLPLVQIPDDGVIGYFAGPGVRNFQPRVPPLDTQKWIYQSGQLRLGNRDSVAVDSYRLQHPYSSLMLLISNKTHSAGISSLVPFGGCEDMHVQTVGQATSSISTANMLRYLSDGGRISLTFARPAHRGGHVYNGAIQPSIPVLDDTDPANKEPPQGAQDSYEVTGTDPVLLAALEALHKRHGSGCGCP